MVDEEGWGWIRSNLDIRLDGNISVSSSPTSRLN